MATYSEQLNVRLAAGVKGRLDKAANRARVTSGEFVRRLVLDAIHRAEREAADEAREAAAAEASPAVNGG